MKSLEEYRKIGREWKARYPGRWDQYSDERLALVLEEEGLIDVDPDALPAAIPHGHDLEAVDEEWRRINHGRTLVRADRAERRNEQTSVLAHDNQIMVLQQANEAQLDVQVHRQKVAKQVEEDIRLNSRQIEINQDTAKDKVLQQQKIEAYQQEVAIDLKALLAQRLMSHEQVLGIKNRLHGLIIEREEIEAMNVSAQTKLRLLSNQDEVIKTFQENLRVQMARHLLEAGDGEDVQGTQQPEDGEANH